MKVDKNITILLDANERAIAELFFDNIITPYCKEANIHCDKCPFDNICGNLPDTPDEFVVYLRRLMKESIE